MVEWDPKVSLGNLLTILTIVISATGFLYTWKKDRDQRRKEYEDRERRALGTVESKLERWRALSLGFYSRIQSALTEADLRATHEDRDCRFPENILAARDLLWMKLNAVRSEVEDQMLEDQIELAYVDLYGYDPGSYRKFSETLRELKELDRAMYDRTRDSTQEDILSFNGQQPRSPEVGNQLRGTCAEIEAELQHAIDASIDKLIGPLHARQQAPRSLRTAIWAAALRR